MTYRHFDWVYFNIIDGNAVECLKHKTTFVNIYTIGRFQRHCNDFILTPISFVSYLSKWYKNTSTVRQARISNLLYT